MANFLRVIFILLSLYASNAHALVPSVIYVIQINQGTWSGATADAVCQTAGPFIVYSAYTYVSASVVGDQCRALSAENGYYSASISKRTACPANSYSTDNGSTCTCTPPSVENAAHTACEAPKDQDDETCNSAAVIDNSTFGTGGYGFSAPGKHSSGIVCLDTEGMTGGKGCRANFELDAAFYDAQTDTWVSRGTARRLGGDKQSCVGAQPDSPPTPENPPAAEPSKCPPGQMPGKVNGLDICAKIGAEVPKETNTKKEENTVKPDGSTVGEVTTEKTECDGKNCTTTKTKVVTKTPADGGAPVVETETNTSVCKVGQGSCGVTPGGTGSGGAGGQGSSFTGACAAGFNCTGDAIQCAMAQEQHQQNCKLYTPDTEPTSAFNQAVNGTDGFSMDSIKSQAQTVSIQQFDTQGRGWSKSCPADPQISLGFGGTNASFSIPFSRICGPLQILALAGVGITLLGSMLWVLGGKKS